MRTIIIGNVLLWLNVLVNNFSVMPDWSQRFLGITSAFRGSKCVFAQGHNTAEVVIEPPTSRSGIRGSSTRSLRSLAGNEDMHKCLGEFVFLPDPTTELSALEHLNNLCTMLLPLLCTFICDRIYVILACSENEFKFSPDPYSDCGVSFP